MNLPIVWTLKALRTYNVLIDFWQQAYPEQIVDGFYQQVEQVCSGFRTCPTCTQLLSNALP